ncbi:hypothetical protein F5Y13DRAFT_148960 [Hypoxylon sp. FL1857]|nr:hypothetical protein F5Y13DRAFT_148960 [Hypoxylon sp. FL1857]
MEPVTGGPNLLFMGREEWIYRRSFNNGFSNGAMLNNVPHIADSIMVFRGEPVEMVGKGMFSLDEFTTKTTIEIILEVTLDSNYQRSPHVLATALWSIVT